ncbi:MAG: MBL fold metallo-hydrolase [Actinobacteria bacterium]|nr:MAG: MBL fold metallo-hydrolase [Actinomycetota bacterium]
MSEPTAVADHVEEVVPGVWHWSLHDDRIDFVSSAHAVSGPNGTILIDPLPLAEEPLKSLWNVAAICVTAGSHQRSSWRCRRELHAPVHAPQLSRELEEEPDVRYGDGDELPGGLAAVFTPGAGTTQHTFLLAREGGVAFVPDLLVRPPEGELMLIPDEYYDGELARRSVERLLDLPFAVLCLGHGAPVREEPKRAIEAALAAD